jgi:hypothetical protein
METKEFFDAPFLLLIFHSLSLLYLWCFTSTNWGKFKNIHTLYSKDILISFYESKKLICSFLFRFYSRLFWIINKMKFFKFINNLAAQLLYFEALKEYKKNFFILNLRQFPSIYMPHFTKDIEDEKLRIILMLPFLLLLYISFLHNIKHIHFLLLQLNHILKKTHKFVP